MKKNIKPIISALVSNVDFLKLIYHYQNETLPYPYYEYEDLVFDIKMIIFIYIKKAYGKKLSSDDEVYALIEEIFDYTSKIRL